MTSGRLAVATMLVGLTAGAVGSFASVNAQEAKFRVLIQEIRSLGNSRPQLSRLDRMRLLFSTTRQSSQLSKPPIK
jgi:hypothetical protein